ncbi:MAG: hypothetical protein IK020_01230 [Clostridiales bacterium]|nr:hypothetical protein [Clostridiales bacterium]
MSIRTRKLQHFLAYIVSAAMAFSLCACGEKSEDTSSSVPATSVAQSETSTVATVSDTVPAKEEALKSAPEVYLDAILIQINPSFMLYVDERGDVIRSEAMNDDAKSMSDRCYLDGRNVRDALSDIVNVAIDDGYLKDGGVVNVTLVDSYRTEPDANKTIDDLENVVDRISDERNIDISPVATIDAGIQFASDAENTHPNDDPNPPPPENNPGADRNNDPGQEPGNDPNNAPGNDPNNDPGNNPGTEPDDHQHDTQPDNGGDNGGGKQEGCPVCQGSGKCTRCDEDGYETCYRCGATGYEPCTCEGGYDPNPCPCGGDGKCYRCEGTGVFEGNTCDVCGGDGLCKECHGSGRRTCAKCNGTGQTPCEDCHGAGKVICAGCQGTRVCEACGGTGLNPHKQE